MVSSRSHASLVRRQTNNRLNRFYAASQHVIPAQRKSFLSALDEAGIAHSRDLMCSSGPQASGFKEIISGISDAMPWNIVAVIEARSSREAMISTEGGQIFYAKGCSTAEVKELLPKFCGVMIIGTNSYEES